ncbi:energy transducer TonB [Emticicia sp. 21SJ11W-3]|uniref:energy transducer TonB n=1 Tax=Emticicia sp. 21SJ11W-3 TaxID=2916755 RepID=UPI00209D6086|nr:energy transducer TonB [Emticicia sp. 21SJ11W-3]UTA67259.1 TonB family protein [Emticicia sp. 21SJ11W-3]
MKTLTLLLLSLTILTTAAQELKLVSKSSQPNPFTNYKEEYYVLKNDKKNRQGSYKKWVNGKISLEGFYKNDKMDSTWTTFSSLGYIISSGNYAKDTKVGIWKFNDKDGLEQEYNYSTNMLVYFRPEKTPTNYAIIKGTDTTYSVVSRPPLTIGGSYALYETIAKNLRYPVAAHKKNATGKVYVSFTIDETGNAAGHKVLKNGNKDLDNEALRVVKLLDKWIPALKDGIPVKVVHVIPVTFQNAGIINP